MNRFIQTAVVSVISVVAVGLMVAPAEAATRTQVDIDTSEGDFIVGPGQQEVSLPPGESTIKTISVTNRTPDATEFSISLEDFTSAEGNDQAVKLLGDQRGPNSLRDLVTPELQEFTLDSGEKIEFSVDVSIPEGAEPGGRYGAVIVSNEPGSGTATGTAVQTRTRLASLFLVEVEGDLNREGQLSDFRVSGPSNTFWEDGPQGFEVLFENTGNIHLTPYGEIEVSNVFGQTVDTLPIDAYFALPDSTRYREVSFDSGFMIGPYTAKLDLNRSYDDRIDRAEVSFWVIPWRVLSVGLIALFILIGIINWLRRRLSWDSE